MKTTELRTYVEQNEIEAIEELLKSFKEEDFNLFRKCIEKLKLIFINSNDINLLNKIAIVFNEFVIHSASSLIVSKLISGHYNKNGGTLIYALAGLRKQEFTDDLQELWQRRISYEMKQMLLLNRIYSEKISQNK